MAFSDTGMSDRGSRAFVASMMAEPLLERDEEFELARAWRDDGDTKALHRMVRSYGRFVVRIAWRFRGYGLPVSDLIQEGNIGLMEAAARFDPEREARFSTYASWWIMAAIQDHILRNTSIVRVATTPAQRRLFFNLRRLRAKLAGRKNGPLTSEDHEEIAAALNVKPIDVERMEVHLGAPDMSLHAPVGGGDDAAERIEFLADGQSSPEETVSRKLDRQTHGEMIEAALGQLTDRERQIIVRRFLEDDKSTLADIGTTFGVSKERIRQLEARSLEKLKTILEPAINTREIGELNA